MVAEWIDSFPITAYVSDTMEHIYPGASDKDNQDQVSEKDTRIGPRHKKEGKKRRELDADYRC